MQESVCLVGNGGTQLKQIRRQKKSSEADEVKRCSEFGQGDLRNVNSVMARNVRHLFVFSVKCRSCAHFL